MKRTAHDLRKLPAKTPLNSRPNRRKMGTEHPFGRFHNSGDNPTHERGYQLNFRRPNGFWDDYRLRAQVCLAIALAVCAGLVRFWPPPTDEHVTAARYSARGQEVIEIEQILPTRQQKAKPAPPAPLPPVEVPNDQLLEDVALELDQPLSLDDTESVDDATREGLTSGDVTNLPRASVDARAIRIVTPSRSREAERKKIKAEVKVEILVGRRGEVLEVRIVERYLLTGKEPYEREPVDELGYGLEESAIAAARETQFRPASDGGKPVESYTSLVFSFGV